MREGGCLCGAVRYRVEGEPVMTGLCHCRTCRRAASAPVLPFSVFPIEAFAVTRGTSVAFASSPIVTRSFCGRCGSPLTYRSAHEPTIDVMTCSLDDPDSLRPTFHVWTSHKIRWETVSDGLQAYLQSREPPPGSQET